MIFTLPFWVYLALLDLVKFGLIPEFIGRLPVVAAVNHLDEQALVRILTEPRNSLVKQYQGLFDLGEVKIHFSMAALHAIAGQAIEKQTGARGLRRIMVRELLTLAEGEITLKSGNLLFCPNSLLLCRNRCCWMSCMMHQGLLSSIL